MDAWRAPGPDPDALILLQDTISRGISLQAIAHFTPIMNMQLAQYTPSAIYWFLHHQRCARQAIIATSATEITAINAVHNALFPLACRLPAEVLAEVFSYLGNHRPGSRSNCDLLNAMSTCKRWRDVGCGIARLWTEIPLYNNTLLAASLQRSHALPLTLYLEGKKQQLDPHQAAVLLLPHTGRIKHLDISCPDFEALQVFCNNLQGPTPLLETVHIGYTKIGGHEMSLDPPFGGNMPALRSLALDRILLPSNPMWTNNLRELKMRDTLPSLPAMLDFLDQCHSLRTLTVEGYHTWPEDANQPDLHVVSLPSLELLDVRTQPIPAGEDLLAHLDLPETARLCLEADMMIDESLPVDLPDLHLCNHIPAIRDLTRVEICWSEPSQIVFRGFHRIGGHGAPDIEIYISDFSNFMELPDDWSLDLSQVEILIIQMDGIGELSLEVWDALLNFNFVGLSTIRLIEPDPASAKSLMSALARPSNDDPADPQSLLCPLLQTLELFDLKLNDEIKNRMLHLLLRRTVYEPSPFVHLDVRNADEDQSGRGVLEMHNGMKPPTLVLTKVD